MRQKLANLAQGDRIEIVPSARALEGPAVTVREASRISSVVALLEPSYQLPSLSIRAATLGFYKGDEVLADVWLYVNGDWGFIGGGGTVGKSNPLLDLIREQVARGSATTDGA